MNSDSNLLGQHIKRMTDAHGYKIEPGDPDPRGWPVMLGSDRLGVVDDLLIDTEIMKVRYFDVRLDGTTHAHLTSGGHALLDATKAEVAGERLLVQDVSALQMTTAASATGAADTTGTRRDRNSTDNEKRVTRSEEELRVGTREVVSGEARVTKHVETEHVRQPVTTRHEELVIERRPVEAVTARESTIGEDEVRIPLHSEEAVLEKRPVVKEEVVIGKRVVEERGTVEADVRRERLDIDEGRTSSGRSEVTDRPDAPGRGRDRF